ncbi:MAG TPA: 5-methyltetrahydropteroyltriglutamate--homocysteine S-methyltransferase [Candidatus Limnocylindria bacterium]
MDLRAHLIGYPRIGPNRELKRALERAWSGRMETDAFLERIAELRSDHLDEQRDAIGSAVDDYFLYDAVLETAMMLGLVPAEDRSRLAEDPFAVLTALARGTPEREAWEMTKWFDTNYHYVVPEIDRAPDALRPLPWREPIADASWVVIGPYTLVKLSKHAPGPDAAETARQVGDALWAWVRQHPDLPLQLDEPSLGMVLDEADRAIRDAAYAGAADLGLRTTPIVTVQFGKASAETVETLGRIGFAVQVALEDVPSLKGTVAWEAQPEHVVAVMDGRSVWPDDFERARAALADADDGKPTHLVPSTSLMFLPVTVEGEDLPAGFQFAREKARALAEWPAALASGAAPDVPQPPPVQWPEVGELRARAPRQERQAAQRDLDLPAYPTTTTGSLPQTTEVRQLRVQLGKGELDRGGYDDAMAKLITDSIGWQERIGLDVLVHGEFERTDMVEYFAEQMDGFLTTHNGWVLSYGSRCVRAPILAAPPSISEPMTVDEWRVAQEATSKPVKGMLTGPVTIVNWSFRPPGVPDDRLFWAVAQPIAEEVGFLVDAGARVIQVDEPAVRERWPLPTVDAPRLREVYARGVRAALNHVFNQPSAVQMHTHMCYGDFGDIVPLWSDAGVDVASVEFSRSKDDSYIRQFYGLFTDGHLQIGPGVFDVHSPHTPGASVMSERLHHFREFMDVGDLWVNPDCGLKTRRWEEIERQLGDMVAAAREMRNGA